MERRRIFSYSPSRALNFAMNLTLKMRICENRFYQEPTPGNISHTFHMTTPFVVVNIQKYLVIHLFFVWYSFGVYWKSFFLFSVQTDELRRYISGFNAQQIVTIIIRFSRWFSLHCQLHNEIDTANGLQSILNNYRFKFNSIKCSQVPLEGVITLYRFPATETWVA